MSLKSALISELERNRGGYLSGQALADRLGVSRNAVWKTVNALRAGGYDIRSRTNLGYGLAPGCDVLSAEGIAAWLPARYAGLPLRVFPEIDSTNSEARRLLANGLAQPTLVAADRQTAGRGRSGRSFYSPAGTGLYMSLVLFPDTDLADAVRLTAAAAVAVVRAVEALTDRRPGIKWVNDIYLDGRKICGILTEAAAGLESGRPQGVVVGIGLNVATERFPDELADTAASLFPVGVPRNRLAAAIAAELLALAEDPADGRFMADYRAHSLAPGRAVTYTAGGETRRALAVGIDDAGGLVVEDAAGRRTVLRSGEISLRIEK